MAGVEVAGEGEDAAAGAVVGEDIAAGFDGGTNGLL